MNDLNSPKKESVFKVYKDKLNFFKPKTPSNTSSQTQPTPDKKQPPHDIKTNTSSLPKDNPTPSIGLKPSIDELLASEQTKANPTKHKKIYPETPPQQPQSPLQKHNFTTPLIIKSILVILAILILGYIIVNFNALYLLFDYWYKVDIQNQKWSDLHPIELIKAKTTAQKLDENYLYIPTLGIQAPVTWGVEEKDASGLLSSGLVQYLASALPDDATGNIYIAGSTSGPIWSASNYKTIFTLLGNINRENVITLIYNNKIYAYNVESIGFVSNNDILITPGTEEDSYLNLLARFPVGINWHTLVVRAKLFKIESNIAQSINDKIESLPEKYTDIELKPIEVSPSPTTIPIPTDNKLPNPELLPDHFLPNI
jgi:LPXTG-site transpeptidase (sortase) family protein